MIRQAALLLTHLFRGAVRIVSERASVYFTFKFTITDAHGHRRLSGLPFLGVT